MYHIFVSYHLSGPIIVDPAKQIGAEMLLQAQFRGIHVKSIFKSEDRTSCIDAWEKFINVCKDQNFQCN